MLTKSSPSYVHVDPGFKPLPKYGHLSEPTPEFAAAESVIGAAHSILWDCPDWPTLRETAGDADATMPPNGPDRYRDVTTELIHFPARDGVTIELKVYKSPNVLPDATLMYRMHGGGWTVGRHEVDGAENVYAATNPRIIVASVDYRKAPEHPFPQPLHDSYDGLLWCKKNFKLLGINPKEIILSGGSAGANLAAVLAIEARDTFIHISAQVLHFPSVCHPKFFPADKYEFGSWVQNYSNCVLSTLSMEAFFDSYMLNPQPDYKVSPLLAESLKGLPPTFKSLTSQSLPSCIIRPRIDTWVVIQCAGVDILRDEAFAYAEALEAAGVDVETYCYAGVPHCFNAALLSAPETSQFYKRYYDFLEKHASGNKPGREI